MGWVVGANCLQQIISSSSVWEPCEEAWHSEGRWEWRMEVAKCPAHAFHPSCGQAGPLPSLLVGVGKQGFQCHSWSVLGAVHVWWGD